MTSKFLTVTEAFERAKVDAPGIAEEDFLSQLVAHLQSGRIAASAYDCVIEQGLHGDLGAMRYVPRTPEDMQRRDIAAVEWIELAIHMESATAQRWGHDRAPQWTRDGGDGAPVWGDGYFDKAPVYTDLLICSVSGSLKGRFVAPAENGVCDDEARAIITTEQVKRGGFISQNDAAKIVRAALPKFPRDRARDIAKSVTGNGKRGPRGPRKNCAE